MGCEPSREPQPGSCSSPERGQHRANKFGLSWCWTDGSSGWFIPAPRWLGAAVCGGSTGASPEGIGALQAPLVLRDIGIQQGQEPGAGQSLALSPRDALLCLCLASVECCVGLGRAWGFVCCSEIMFCLIHSSSLAWFLSIFSKFYKIKFCFFTRTLPSIAFVQQE